MGLYTRNGDSGETDLGDGRRIGKQHVRVEACGAIDELNSALGLAAAACPEQDLAHRLQSVQHDLFLAGAELAAAVGDVSAEKLDVRRIERWIDQAEQRLEPLRRFILPGGCELAGRLHLARTICRRAERRVAALAASETISPTVLAYLNRLGDLLFVWARLANRLAGVPDVPWAAEGRQETAPE